MIVAGIRTEQCCETATRHASDEGWKVDYVTEATLTFDMQTPAGAMPSAAAIRERTETVLTGRFATLCTAAQALEHAGSDMSATRRVGILMPPGCCLGWSPPSRHRSTCAPSRAASDAARLAGFEAPRRLRQALSRQA